MEIPHEVKKALIENEIQLHKNSAYLMELRHRVNKKLGATPEELKQLADDIVKHEQAIDLLNEELKTIDG
jgi:hypothetical protein